MAKLFSLLLLLMLALVSGGCSTLLQSDGHQDVDITTTNGESMPVLLYENGKKRVVTVPAEISILRENTYATFVNHPCYDPPFAQRAEKEFDYLSLLNFSMGGFGLIGFSIDASTDMMWQYEEPVTLPAGTLNPDCNASNGTPAHRQGKSPFQNGDLPVEKSPVFTDFEMEDILHRSGIILSRFGGEATVSSSVTEASGKKRVIANGHEAHEGYQLAFRNPARQKALYYSFVPRIMQHRITVADFRESIPATAVEGKTTIPYTVTNFYTGQTVDPLDPNRYTIRLDAGGLDLIGGSSFTYHGKDAGRYILNLGISAGVTLIEYQHLDLHLGHDRAETNRFIGLHAYQGSINGYLIFPDWENFFVEFGYLYLHYPDIDLPKKVEFKNTTRYNTDKQIYERERVFVDSVELEIATFSFSLGVLF